MKKKNDDLGLRDVSRRDFARGIAGLGIASALPKGALKLAEHPSVEVRQPDASVPGSAAQSAPQVNSARQCDLLLKGGTVIDPSQNLHARMDVAVKAGKIFEVSPNFPEDAADVVLWVKDKIVTPGLIDILTHGFSGVGIEVPYGGIDLNCLVKGTTTAVDMGEASAPMIAGFRKYVVDTSFTRVYALLNIGVSADLTYAGSNADLRFVNVQQTARAALANKPVVVGIFVRIGEPVTGTKETELECLKRGVEAAKLAGLPLVVDSYFQFTPMSTLLPMLRKGDIFTHMFNKERGLLDANGKILPEVKDARQRGVLFDAGHSTVHFDFVTAERIVQQGFLPDTVSTAMIARHLHKPYEGQPDLPTFLSKFLYLGLSLDKIIELSTIGPAGVFDYGTQLGTLRPGMDADISVFEVRDGEVEFTDFLANKRTGHQKLVPAAVVRSGKALEIMDLHP